MVPASSVTTERLRSLSFEEGCSLGQSGAKKKDPA